MSSIYNHSRNLGLMDLAGLMLMGWLGPNSGSRLALLLQTVAGTLALRKASPSEPCYKLLIYSLVAL